MATATKAAKTAAAEDARAAALNAFIKRATKKDDGAVFTFNGRSLDVPVIPTGALSLDYALGVGGLPRGRIVEIYGPESAGKTSLALSVGAQAQKAGGMVGYVDVEHAINPDHLQGMGIDLDYFALSQPSSGEEALQMAEEMVKEGIFDVVVVDSVAALVTQRELNGEIGDATVGEQARLMSSALRRLVSVIAQSDAVVIFINQIRMKVGQMFGNPEDTAGGKALKYYASVRISITAPPSAKIMDKKDSKKQIGIGTRARIVKCKVAPPQKIAEYKLIWGEGIDFADSVFDVALAVGAIYDSGGYNYAFAATGEIIARGKDKAKEALSENPELAEAIADQVRVMMAEQRAGNPVSEDVEQPLPDEAFDDSIAGDDAAIGDVA